MGWVFSMLLVFSTCDPGLQDTIDLGIKIVPHASDGPRIGFNGFWSQAFELKVFAVFVIILVESRIVW